MKKILNSFWHYRLHYFLLSFAVFFGGWLLAAKKNGQWWPNLFVCMLYAAGIAAIAFITEQYLLPFFLFRKKKLYFSAAVLLIVLVTALVLFYLQAHFGDASFLLYIKGSPVLSFLLSYFFPLAFAAIIITVTGVFRNQQATVSKMEKLQHEKTQAELSFLKAQINPHFLFNSLNSVYFLIDKQNKAARDTLMKFTEMLRYQLYECNEERISIASETAFLKNYVALQQLRKGDHYSTVVRVGENVSNFAIAPLILINFVENAFKYISNRATAQNSIVIELQREGNWFVFTCVNTTDETSRPEVVDYGGIGLVNTKRRLDIVYGSNYTLSTSKENDLYTVILKLNLFAA
jgi:two-component system, LytTR family, sensor kinase